MSEPGEPGEPGDPERLPEDSAEELLPPESSATDDASATSMSRRHFLRLAGIAAGSLVGAGIAVNHLVVQHDRDEQEHQEGLQAAANLGKLVSEGLEGNWQKATVWPGLAFIPRSVQLFSTPTLQEGTKVAWPDDHLQDHLAVQRPFMIWSTAEANKPTEPALREDSVIGEVYPETLGFWLPNSNQLAYCNRGQYWNDILLPTHSQDPIYQGAKDGYQTIVGEAVTLQPALRREGLVWRYLSIIGRLDSDLQSFEWTKVCGRSQWDNMSDTTKDYYDDEANQGDGGDLISLPPPRGSQSG